MTSSWHGPDENEEGSIGSSAISTPRGSRLIASVCSCVALFAVFRGVAQFDLPVTRYVRSVTIHLPWDQLTIPWMAFTSNAGDWIGEGMNLVVVSVVLLVAGWIFARPNILKAGFESAVAHGLAALFSNGLKHLLGRPRPKFVHSGEWEFAPSMESGLDSFPSGHTSATFAVATVFVKRFPILAPLWLGLASFVGLSRVLRGAHFPTDIFGGAVMGVLCGSIAAAPWHAWRSSLEEGLRHAAIGSTIVFGLLSTLARPAETGLAGFALVALGACAVAAGLWLRRHVWLGTDRPDRFNGWHVKMSRILIAYGLACMTTEPLVMAAAGFVGLAYYLSGGNPGGSQTTYSRRRALVQEAALACGIIGASFILFGSRAVLPFQ